MKLKDARSGSIVTIQNSEVKEISEGEYKAGLAAPVSKPAPAEALFRRLRQHRVLCLHRLPPAPAIVPSSAPTGTK